MSEESISYGEDKDNLLYIAKKINIDEFGLYDEGLFRESLPPEDQLSGRSALGSDFDFLEQLTKAKTFSNPEIVAKLKPFTLEWSYGMNSNVGIRYLTNEDRTELFYTSCHTVIIYDFYLKQMTHLEGHQSVIKCISTDRNGEWLVTADHNGCVIIWHKRDLKPVRTLFSLYPESGVLLTELSCCARYLITIGEYDNCYKVDFWLWTLGEDKPNGRDGKHPLYIPMGKNGKTIKVGKSYLTGVKIHVSGTAPINYLDTFAVNKTNGAPMKICFNPDVREHIMLVFEKQVLFLIWDEMLKRFEKSYAPQIMNKAKIGTLTCGVYMSRCHESYVSSGRGYILVFRTTLYGREYEEGEINNDKMFINAVKVTTAPIGVLTTTNGVLVIGDSRGHIYFFDKKVKIVYWMRNFCLGPVTDISFPSKKNKYLEEEVKKKPIDNNYATDVNFQDAHEDIANYMARETPPDKNLEGELAGKFFVSTADCNIYVIDFADGKCDPIFHIADANVTAVDAHDEKPYLAVGYENGRISLINFESKEQINTATLPKTDENPSISCIKYSLNSLHLICGRYSGEICILEPVTLEHKFCFKCTKSKVEKIAFSRNCLQFACYDYNKTVVLFRYDPDSSRWELQGKLRSHYDLINDLMFIPSNDQAKSVLCTIGCDRYLVQYITDLRDGPFRIKSRHRIEQTAVPMNFLYFVKDVDENRSVGYILIADDKHKLKFLHEATKIPRALILGPAFGCFDESHIRKMEILPHHSSRYMIFVCQKRLGLQILPPDGNPFKYTGYLAQPNEVKDFTISHDGRSVFTFGGDDRCILQWEVKPRSVEVLRVMGGTELEPFYCLLEGGKNGWLFQEMQDLFFYMQILQQDNIDLPRRMSDSLNISELPDLVRTCGYYPSDFELELLLLEAKYQDFDETGVIRDEISFVEFAKLFANHRPAYGYSSTHMREIFDVIAGMAEFPQSGKIETSEFLYLLQSVGEPCINLHKHLATLLRTGAVYEENNYEFLPEEIDAKFLFDEMLGICKSSSPRQVEDEDEQ